VRISELENVDPNNIVQVGIRATDREGRRMGEKLGITTFYARETLRRGFENVIKEAIDIAKDGTDYLYCTVDVDVLDAAYAPATSWPSPGGPTTMQLMNAVGMIGKAGADAFDLVEVFPRGDPNLITARAAGWITREFLLNHVLKKLGR
jgi:arginase family enzyme